MMGRTQILFPGPCFFPAHIAAKAVALASKKCFAPVLLFLLSASALGQDVSFRKDIAPVLIQHCLSCHGPRKAKSGYRVDTFELLMKPGKSKLSAVTPGKPGDGELYLLLTAKDKDERMPQDADPLPAGQITLIRKWIEQGAKFDGPGGKRSAPLVSILPAPQHPDPPKIYSRPVPIGALGFSADGAKLYAGGYHEITVWDAAKGKLIRRIARQGQRSYAIAESPDGKLLASASGTPGQLGELRIFDPASGKLLKVIASASDVALDLAFGPKGRLIALAAADNRIRVYELATGKLKLDLPNHSGWVCSVRFNKDGSRLASASRDRTAKIFETATGKQLATYNGHGKAVFGVLFHPNGKEMYSCGEDKHIHRWNISDGKKKATVGTFGGEVYRLTPIDNTFIAVSADKSVRQYDANSQKQIRTYAGHSDWVLSAAYSQTTRRLATGSHNGEIRIWNLDDGKLIQRFIAAPGHLKRKGP